MRKLENRKGSIPSAITPIRAGAADCDAYAWLVESQLQEGSQGVWVNGTTAGRRRDAGRERARRLTSNGQSA